MSKRDDKENKKLKFNFNKAMIVITVASLVIATLTVVAFNSYNTRKTIYLRPDPNTSALTTQVKSVILQYEQTVKFNTFEETIQYNITFNTFTNVSEYLNWSAFFSTFNEKITVLKDITSFKLIIVIKDGINDVIYTTPFILEYRISVITISGFDEILHEVEITIAEVNPFYELFSYL